MSLIEPFIDFKMNPTNEINSTPTIIFGNDQHTCFLDTIFLTNLANNTSLINLYIAREVTTGQETDFFILQNFPLQAYQRVDVIERSILTLEPGDLLYAYSDASFNTFNSFISYRILNQLPNIQNFQRSFH